MELNSQLLSRLDYVTATREARAAMAREILAQPETLKDLLQIGVGRQDAIGSRAFWILEFVYKASPTLLHDHLDPFCEGLGALREESSIRPAAKVCELLVKAYYGKQKAPPLTLRHRELITAACFDWLIGPHKVAPQAYSMETLYLLGHDIPWIHPELKAILDQHYAQGSAGYQARARKILERMDKSG